MPTAATCLAREQGSTFVLMCTLGAQFSSGVPSLLPAAQGVAAVESSFVAKTARL